MGIGGVLASLAVPRWLAPHLAFAEGLLPAGALGWARIAAPWAAALAAAIAGASLSRGCNYLLGWFFRGFNWSFFHARSVYLRLVGLALRGSVVVLVVSGGLILLTWWDFTHLPTTYLPNHDQ